ncbi:DNA helicase PIF1/RRM3 [Trachipleistophora hominis]|uniref:DNA helicase PIF1/RRM3 n=1 Tax=Trachipleistophora hominis TaxID=72359 RepID=L7JS08_TRAHO|nr:DNA helicase PIF1/RRM3 [Trachipleistophora hominis]
MVDKLNNNFIIAMIVTGYTKGNRAIILKVDMAQSETQLPFILKQKQFPVLLPFAMAIHKSQGQSFDKVGVYLHSPVFVHRQLYVALPRVRHADDLKVYIADNGDQDKADNNMVYTRNVVYNELLR